MSEQERQINLLFTAELQFRLASAVHLATTMKYQPLDVPIEWIHGRHRVTYEEIGLREDQADYAAFFMHRSATYLLAVAIKEAIKAAFPDPRNSSDDGVRAAYQIARLIRNAFAHSPFAPTWLIDANCRDQHFEIPQIIELNTTGLHDTRFDWRQYGGPLALFRLCRYVRIDLLKDTPAPRKPVPKPTRHFVQQGNLIAERFDQLPPNAVPVEIVRLPDGGIPLGGGHVLYPGKGGDPS